MGQAGACARLRLVIVIGLSIIMTSSLSSASEVWLESLSIRGGLSGWSPIGEEQQSDFNQFDVAATARLPWQLDFGSGWVFGPRLLASGGALRGGQETNGVFTFLPLDVTFGRKDQRFAIDIGVGGALLTDYKFGKQNFGGPFQFVWTYGATSRLVGPLGVAYHFQHYSDAAMYGSDSRGVDLHLFELIYWFGIGH